MDGVITQNTSSKLLWEQLKKLLLYLWGREICFVEQFLVFISSVRSSYSHPDLLLTHPPHPTFSDHTGPQHWTFTF